MLGHTLQICKKVFKNHTVSDLQDQQFNETDVLVLGVICVLQGDCTLAHKCGFFESGAPTTAYHVLT